MVILLHWHRFIFSLAGSRQNDIENAVAVTGNRYDQPQIYCTRSLILTCKPYRHRVQLNIGLSPPFKLRCVFSFEEIVALFFFPTDDKFQTFQVQMQTDGLAPCPSSVYPATQVVSG